MRCLEIIIIGAYTNPYKLKCVKMAIVIYLFLYYLAIAILCRSDAFDDLIVTIGVIKNRLYLSESTKSQYYREPKDAEHNMLRVGILLYYIILIVSDRVHKYCNYYPDD